MAISFLSLDYQALAYKREKIREGLSLCTEREIDLFNRMYKSIEAIKEKDMNNAYDQIMRTLIVRRNLTDQAQKEGRLICQ